MSGAHSQPGARPWWKKKRFVIPIAAFGVLLFIGALGNITNPKTQNASASHPATTSSTNSTTAPTSTTVPRAVAATATPGQTTTTTAATTPAAKAQTTCEAFKVFYNDLLTYTPHDPRIPTDADQVLHAAIATNASQALLADATDLESYVHSSDWNTNGNVYSPPVEKMSNDCP